MKLRSRLHLFSLSILSVMTVSVLAAGILIINELVHDHHYQILQTQLGIVRTNVVETLNQSGVNGVAEEIERLQSKLRKGPLGLESVHIYIIEAPDRVIYHPDYQTGDRILRDDLASLFAQGGGAVEYTSNKDKHFAVYTTLKPIDWMIFISLDEGEIYSTGAEYLRHIILISVAIFALSVLMVGFYVKRFAARQQSGINAVSADNHTRTLVPHEAERSPGGSETKFRDLVQKLQAAIIVHGPDTRILTANTMAQDFLGMSETQIRGKPANDPVWHFLREDGSVMPQEEYPVNRVLASHRLLQNLVIGVERSDREEPRWALVSALPVPDKTNEITEVIVSFTDITERKKAEQQLAASEQLFRTLVENSPEHIARYDLKLRRRYINPALENIFTVPLDTTLGQTSMVASPLLDPELYMDNMRQVIATGKEVSDEIAYRTPQGEICWASSRFAPEFDVDGKVRSVLVISNDISERKRAEQERQEYMYFLQNLDRINLVLHAEGGFEQVMEKVLNEVLDIFDCDRAFVLYPCDPEASTWSIPMESNRPEFPGAGQLGPQPMDEDISRIMRMLLETETSVRFGRYAPYPIPESLQERFGVHSLMSKTLHPRVDKPWQFGIHQCTGDRIWTDQEARLFEEISNRLTDNLTDLLVSRNLRENEARFRLVFENSPVPIQEEDYSAVKAHLESLRPEYGDDLGAYLNDHPDVVQACAALVRMLDVNDAALRLHQAESKQVLLKGLPQIFIPETMAAYRQVLISLMNGETHFRHESEIRTLSGKKHSIDTFVSVCSGYEQSLGRVLVSLVDISELKLAEQQRHEHLHFLESLDRINKVLQSEGDMQEILNRALCEVLDIFSCSRANLLYPGDPTSPTWSAPIECTVPEYPGVFELGVEMPMNDMIAWQMKLVNDEDHPVRAGPGNKFPVVDFLRDEFSIRSFIAMALHPKVDRPWQFGIQECSYDRVWTDQEVRLLEEIGHRLSDGLNSLLISRNLRESEARYRQVFENSPVPLQEEDYSAVKRHLESLRPEFDDDLAGYLVDHPEVVDACAALVRLVQINQDAVVLHEADSKEDLSKGIPQIFVPETRDDFRDILVSLMRGETNIRQESVLQTLQGRKYAINAFISVSPGYEESLVKVLVSLIDITELKQAEQERKQHLHFLESLDRINKVLQTDGGMEEILKRTLDEVLDIFDCDRTYLQYPCDPNASSEWTTRMERCKPEYPSSLPPDGHLPYHPHIENTLRALRDSDTAIRLGPDTDHPIPPEITEHLGVRSLLAIALRPKVDRPWHFGIHQCSHERIWTDQESRLFEEISHRLSDGLNNLLITRDLRESEERFRLVYENSPVSVWEEDFSAIKPRLEELKAHSGGDLEGYLMAHPEILEECASLVRIVNVNSATLDLHQADSKEALLQGLQKTFIQESYDAFRKELIAIAEGNTELVLDGAVQTLKGERRVVSVSFSVCPGYEDSLSKVFVSLFDITQRKQAEDQLRLAASVFSTSQEGILISDAENRIIDINPAFTRLTGYSREEALGRDPGFLSAGRQGEAFYAEMWQSLNSTGGWQGELWNQRKSGEIYPELLSIVAVRDEHERLQHYVGAFSDISMIKQHEADLDRIAHYDMLTSAPNRRLLGDRLEQAIAHARRHNKNLAVCYLDLDGFKPINDQFGHEGGDRMLIEIAHRLETISRGEDTVSRLGGDEFVLLWSDIGSETDCANALERVLNKVAEPMLLENQPVSVSASIGVTLYPDDNVDADSLLRHADHAMYTAKQLGKNRYQIFDARQERQISAQIDLMDKIGRGLERGQFELYYQPKVDYTTCEAVGAEALLRWNDPVLGLVGPKEFISLIENDILAFRMGCWVMARAIQQARIWHEHGVTLPISINVFPRHLKHRTFVDDLRNAIALNWPQMPRNQLMIEIVETNDLEEMEPIEQVIRQCRAMGISFSLDDFGTGYSSLIYLRRLSIQELKIDQSFIRDMLEDPEDEAIVVGVIRLGQAFGLQVVAEGVETVEQAQYLVELGCPIVQGYGLGRPMPAHTLEKWYADLNTMECNVCGK